MLKSLTEIPACSCSPDEKEKCGENCLNRQSNFECCPNQCPCKELCTNTRIQMKLFAPVELCQVNGKGYGVKTNLSIKKGTFIQEYVGEVITQDEYEQRLTTQRLTSIIMP